MNLAKVSANGQITVPMEIRKALNLKEGDKILFIERPNGEIVINNASLAALSKAQMALSGLAAAMDVRNEEEAQKLIDEVRYKKEKPE